MTHAHLSSETIGDLLDDALAPPARRIAEEHLERCTACRATAEQLRRMQTDAAALPREMAPPPEVWSSVRAAMHSRLGATRGPGALLSAWRSLAISERTWLAAAGLLLAAGSAGLTAITMRGTSRDGSARVYNVTASESTMTMSLAIPASVQVLEKDLGRSVAVLERTLAERRGTMLPRTAATIEHSLKVIDEAIRDARAAVLDDPSDPALFDALSRGYERKIDLLKRAAELEPRT